MPLGLFHYQLLHQVLERIHFMDEEGALGEAVLHSVSDALNAEGGTIFTLHKDGTLEPTACYGTDLARLKSIPFSTGRGVVGWVVQHGQPVKVDNPSGDTRFFGSADAATGFKTRNILAAPIVSRGDVVGVIEFLNKRENTFTIPDLEMVSMIGREVGIAFENVRLNRSNRASQALLSAMTDSLSAGVLVMDTRQIVLRVNPSALRILGSDDKPGTWEGHPVREKLKGLPGFLEAAGRIVSAEAPVPRSQVSVAIAGQERVIGYSGSPVRDAEGTRLGSTVLFQDITALQSPQ